MKPFLVLQLRPNTKAADGEFEALLNFGGLTNDQVRRVRMEKEGVPLITLDDYSGVIIGGGPSNYSDSEDKKTAEQKKFEAELNQLLDQIVEKDFPLLGACYGHCILAQNLGGVVSKEKYGEEVGGTTIKLTEQGKKDKLLEGLPDQFRALGGHKEACQDVPPGAVLLGTSDACLVQIMRLKNNIYGVQFHPELDVPGIIVRINIYKYAGYFPPEDAEKLIAEVEKEDITVPPMILKKFVELYRK